MKKIEISREKMIKTIKEYKTFTKISLHLKIKKYKLTELIKEDDEYYELFKSINEKKLINIIKKDDEKESIFENSDDEYLFNYFKNRNKELLQMNKEEIEIITRIYFEKYSIKINKKCKYQLISTYIQLYDYIKNKY